MSLECKKNKHNKYYITYDNERSISNICDRLEISIEKFHETFIECGGHYSNRHGYYFSKQEYAEMFIVTLILMPKK